MAHLRLEYTSPGLTDDDDNLVVVEVLAGPAPRAIRPVGRLRMHPAELNALDRLLQRGAVFERPANTYTLCRSDRERELHDGLLRRIERQLVPRR